MRTKTLVLTAALSFAGLATSMAQVYSVNAVGYVNLTLKPRFNLVANQLIRSPDSKLNTLFPGAPNESQVFTYSGGLYTADIYDGSAGQNKWVDANSGDDSLTTLSPGQGFFFYLPPAFGSDLTVTLVGDVPQGDVGMSFPRLFTLAASKVPQQISLTAANGLPDKLEAQFLLFDAATQKYQTALINDGGPGNGQVPPGVGWINAETGDPATPTVTVGQGFFMYNPTVAPLVWTRSFSVD